MSFQARHVSHTRTIRLAAPPEQVFPLFQPLDERLWTEGWEPRILYPADGAAQVGAVFTTGHAGEPESIWTITAHDPARRQIAYVVVTPGVRAGSIAISCAVAGGDESEASVTYTWTALTEAGNVSVAAFTEEHYATFLDEWERAINWYLRHGERPRHH